MSMISAHRISRSADFGRTVKTGVRVGSRDLTTYVLPVGTDWPDAAATRRDVALVGGPWLGLIVSKAVGNAVVRHQVARRLRAAFAYVEQSVDLGEAFVVVRARPSAARRSSDELAGQIRKACTSVIPAAVAGDRSARR